MTSPAIATKLVDRYRPERFADVVGQSSAVKILQKLVELDQPAHMLLHGPAGTGKTSLARIYANGFECTAPDALERPCRNCDACQQFAHSSNCYIELGTVGAQDAREIAGETEPEWGCRYQFFFFDEAQSMHRQAFDQFLKVMERPKSKIYYIFATTNIDAIPLTIIQRCRVAETKLIEDGKLFAYGFKICSLEKIEFDEDALKLLTQLSRGSARNLLESMQQGIEHGLHNADDVKAFYGLQSLHTIPLYIDAVLKRLGAQKEDEILNSWNTDLHSKSEQIYNFLSYLYSSRVLGLDRRSSIFDSLDAGLGTSIAERLSHRARAGKVDEAAFWAGLVRLWQPKKAKISQADFDGAFNEFRDNVNRYIPNVRQVAAWKSSERIGPPRASRVPGPASTPSVFLSASWIKKIKDAADLLVMKEGFYFNACLRFHWKRAGIETPERITAALGAILHRLGNFAKQFGDLYAYIYVHEVHPTFGTVTTVILHLPSALGPMLTAFIRRNLAIKAVGSVSSYRRMSLPRFHGRRLGTAVCFLWSMDMLIRPLSWDTSPFTTLSALSCVYAGAWGRAHFSRPP